MSPPIVSVPSPSLNHQASQNGIQSGRPPISIFPKTDAAGRVLLHQAVPRGLLGAVAFAVDLGAIRSPLGLLRRGSHDGLPMG